MSCVRKLAHLLEYLNLFSSNPHPPALAALDFEPFTTSHDHNHNIDPIPPTLLSRYQTTPNSDADIAHRLPHANSDRTTVPASDKPPIPLSYSPLPARSPASMFISPLPLLTFTCIILVVAYIASYLRKRWYARRKGAAGLQGLELLPTSSVDTLQSSGPGTMPTSSLGTLQTARTVGVAWNPGRRQGRRLGLGAGAGWRTGRLKNLAVGSGWRGGTRLPVSPLARPLPRPESTPIPMPNRNGSSSILSLNAESELLIDLSTPEEKEHEGSNRNPFQNLDQSPSIVYDSILGGSHVWAFDISTGENGAGSSTSTSTAPSSSPSLSHVLSPNTSVELSSPSCLEFKYKHKVAEAPEPIPVRESISLSLSPISDRTPSLPILHDPVPVTMPISPSIPANVVPSEFKTAAELASSLMSTVAIIGPTPMAMLTQLSPSAIHPIPTTPKQGDGEQEKIPHEHMEAYAVYELQGVVQNEERKENKDRQLDPSSQPIEHHVDLQPDEELEFDRQEDDLIVLEDPDPREVKLAIPLLELTLASEEQKPEPELELVGIDGGDELQLDPSLHRSTTEEANPVIKAPQLSAGIESGVDREGGRDDEFTRNYEIHNESQRKNYHEDFRDAIDTNTAVPLIAIPPIVVSASQEHDHPDPDLLPLPICAPSPIRTRTPAQTPTPPASPPSSPPPTLSSRLLLRDRNTNTGPRPAWSLRASDAPALGLSANSNSPPLSPISSPRLHFRDKASVNEEGQENDMSPSASPIMLSTPLPESSTVTPSTSTPVGPCQSDSDLSSRTPSPSTISPSTQPTHRTPETHPRLARSPLDIALAMQLRPGLGLGADPAWMVRFLMSMFGWFAILVGGNGDYL